MSTERLDRVSTFALQGQTVSRALSRKNSASRVRPRWLSGVSGATGGEVASSGSPPTDPPNELAGAFCSGGATVFAVGDFPCGAGAGELGFVGG